MLTFKELHDFLIEIDLLEFETWLQTPQRKVDKYRCVLRLFIGVGYIKEYIQFQCTNRELFYYQDGEDILLKDIKDVILRKDEKMLIAIKDVNKRIDVDEKHEDNITYVLITKELMLATFKKMKDDLSNKLKIDKQVLKFKMHQEYAINKTMKLKEQGVIRILYGHIPRSGKSYIMAGAIISDSIINKGENYLIVTSVPNETIQQYLKVLDCKQLESFNIVYLNSKNVKLCNKNIIVCSKQFLQKKKIDVIRNLEFSMRFFDESHFHMTTGLSKEMLKTYGKTSFTVFITATYGKPINSFKIKPHNHILWNLEDIKDCKDGNIIKLKEKMGDVVDIYTKEEIIKEYASYPELHILTDEIESMENLTNVEINEIKNARKKEWKEIFKLDIDGDFIQKEKIEMLFIKIFSTYMNRIENIKSEVIMIFLPQKGINKISNAIKNLLISYDMVNDYDIICTNSKVTNNSKQYIQDSLQIARKNLKTGIIVLSGRQCSLGVSIKECDIVILLNDSENFDMIFQMMFRCLTEREGKTCGYVFDLNIDRSIKMLVDYSMLMKPEIGDTKKLLKCVLKEGLLHFNDDVKCMETMCKNICDVYTFKDNQDWIYF